jgi:hypothetical protein
VSRASGGARRGRGVTAFPRGFVVAIDVAIDVAI